MILFGTAGIPTTKKGKGLAEGVWEVARLGLDCMEVEFVRGVRMSDQAAVKAGEAAKEAEITLTAHAPYYINLCSKDPEKARSSSERIMETARKCHLFGGMGITFHAAFYQDRDPEVIFQMVARKLKSIIKKLEKENITLTLAPELTGKPSQFGSLDELIRLSREVKEVRPCIDFSHYAAREAGRTNGYEGFKRALMKVRKGLGAKSLKNLHAHVSGIEWGAKGEVRHRMLEDSEFRWKDLIRALVDTDVSGIVICESPVMEQDALLLKKEYLKMLNRKKSK